jgi:hypothetical protein
MRSGLARDVGRNWTGQESGHKFHNLLRTSCARGAWERTTTASMLAQTAIEFPPMQATAMFNLDAIKREIEEKIKNHEGQ